MSTILYYSNFCEHSKKLLQTLSRTAVAKDVHFICIDNRVRDDKDGKIYLQLQNSQRILMPDNITKVPALLLLRQNYTVLYGESIYSYFKPLEQTVTKVATQNNIEPLACGIDSFGGFGGVCSDQYSFFDMDHDSLGTKGNGGMRQPHNYVSFDDNEIITTNANSGGGGKAGGGGGGGMQKIKDGEVKIEDLRRQRDNELSNINYRKF